MGRRDLSDERRPQIVAAAKRAITKYGVDGATQERIAEEAGMSRALIRHYLGNRDAVLDAVWDETVGEYLVAVDETTSVTEPPAEVERAVGRFLESSFVYQEDDAIILAFLHESRKNERIRARTHATYARVEDNVARLIRAASPTIADAEVATRAHALMALSMGALMLDLLNPRGARADRLTGLASSLFPRATASETATEG
ncbi:TetR/AcrR family transcriptional regulator [Microbacterium sp. ANT_H45B]|uniref:TetR/AcrR family transcriptional regulator n=1 Tax=Microbacterium sp. ANT_H45B TaxID=2597346 RepID=UPI0011ECB34E|nr:TetR/AcrR family transcriptional regulator [Microbacterium sp. ANT_H45B]KAA0960093.1 TetR/AcrR family transcriptional regulator [Microbacterium sp. ANT_H45B]